MFPEFTNCYGRIKPTCDMGSLAIQLSNCGWRANLQAADHPRGECLRVESEVVDLSSEPLEGGQHLINGAFDGSRGELAINKLSNDLRDLQVPHSFELYDESDRLYREIKSA